MSQEATIIAVDDSDFMRNGDFPPSRLQAQNEAVSLICQSKRQKNPENTLGLLSLAKTEVLCTLTNDSSKIYNRLHTVEPKGNISFCTSIQIAHLALRHRQLRHQRMRIVCFVGSPILDDEKAMIKLAKRLKKEKVNVDVINFGENEANQQKLVEFIDTLNGKDGGFSHLVSVPPGAVLHDSLLTSPVLAGEHGTALANTGLGLGFGLDASEDPDFLYALRVSMEEQRRRQETDAATGASAAANVTTSLPAVSGTSEEAMLEQALAMSMDINAGGTRPAARMDIDLAAMTEEEQIAYALEMSLQQQNDVQPAPPKEVDKPDTSATPMEVDHPAPTSGGTLASAAAAVLGPSGAEVGGTDLDVIHDADFLQSVLLNLPGVNPDSEEVRKAISALSKPNPSQSDKKDETKDDTSGGGTTGASKP
ncbi:26S proteasome non-ATPase regulatory subunit 4 [Fasciola gigantica]|uniref:26S proteasome non-ATPase regulatory subunit 4 n=1 Tax=Fasciola gigantica TaxID=46835 RepID=A0A504YX21_FASGI|nr:26S proteasome non-ATPase regulatory subunit 4 [Fasciola gigantica]